MNIKDYGASGEGSDVTVIIQKAIDDITHKGGGVVRVPADKYVISTVFLNLNLGTAGGGVLVEDFPEKPNGYPNMYYLYEQLPAYGMYMRHVKKISLENVNISCKKSDQRPMLISVDTKQINHIISK